MEGIHVASRKLSLYFSGEMGLGSVENEGIEHGRLSLAQVSLGKTCSQQYFFAHNWEALSR